MIIQLHYKYEIFAFYRDKDFDIESWANANKSNLKLLGVHKVEYEYI